LGQANLGQPRYLLCGTPAPNPAYNNKSSTQWASLALHAWLCRRCPASSGTNPWCVLCGLLQLAKRVLSPSTERACLCLAHLQMLCLGIPLGLGQVVGLASMPAILNW
jgi:hypothetical protein